MMKYEVPKMEVVLFDDSVLTDQVTPSTTIPDPGWGDMDSIPGGKGSVLGGEDWWYE